MELKISNDDGTGDADLLELRILIGWNWGYWLDLTDKALLKELRILI